MAKTIWIKSNGSASVRVNGIMVVKKTDEEGKGVTEQVKFTKDINRRKTDRLTGEVVDRGYTPMSIDEFDALMKTSNIFKSYIDREVFVKFDEAPDESFSDAERVVNLELKVQELTTEKVTLATELDEAKKELEASGEALAAAEEEVTRLTAELNTVKEDAEKQKKEAEAQIEALKKDLKAATKKAPAADTGA